MSYLISGLTTLLLLLLQSLYNGKILKYIMERVENIVVIFLPKIHNNLERL